MNQFVDDSLLEDVKELRVRVADLENKLECARRVSKIEEPDLSSRKQNWEKIIDDLDYLNRCLHDQPDGVIGGPLHTITDDGNIRDRDIMACHQWMEHYDAHVPDVIIRIICRAMIDLLMKLTEPQRLVWFMSERIRLSGVDVVALIERVRGGDIVDGSAGLYANKIKVGDEVVWEGFDPNSR